MAETPSEVLIKQVQKIRVRRGWSQQDLAERLQALGLPIDRTIIAKLESGKRGVSLDEALTLAMALGVAPSSLIFPRSDDGTVKITPGMEVSTFQALAWFRGAFPISDPNASPEENYDENRAYYEELTDREAAAVRRHPLLRSIWEEVGIAFTFAAHPEGIWDLVGVLEIVQEDVKVELRKARREMAKAEQDGTERW